MKEYPSINGSANLPVSLNEPCVAFYKYDGSNLRWEWSRKRGYFKYGTRHKLFDIKEPLYSQAIPIFNNGIGPVVEKLLTSEFKGLQEFTVYTEFFGQSSFAGTHVLEEPKELKLIDVNIFKKGLIDLNTFIKLFDDYDFSAKIIYSGNLNKSFITDVREGRYDVDEGVVCKGIYTGSYRHHQRWMVKIKTYQYLQKLKDTFKDDWIKYAE